MKSGQFEVHADYKPAGDQPEAIAKLMNENYVCIKIDREERPDIDEIYMAAVQALNDGRQVIVDYLAWLGLREGAFDRLPQDYRDALLHVGIAGLSYAEAGQIMQRTADSIRKLVHRARARLATLLD